MNIEWTDEYPAKIVLKREARAMVKALREHGQDRLADRLTEYYLCGWDYFLSGCQDTKAARW